MPLALADLRLHAPTNLLLFPSGFATGLSLAVAFCPIFKLTHLAALFGRQPAGAHRATLKTKPFHEDAARFFPIKMLLLADWFGVKEFRVKTGSDD